MTCLLFVEFLIIKSLFLRQVGNTTVSCLFPLAVFIVKILSVLTRAFLYVLILNSQSKLRNIRQFNQIIFEVFFLG